MGRAISHGPSSSRSTAASTPIAPVPPRGRSWVSWAASRRSLGTGGGWRGTCSLLPSTCGVPMLRCAGWLRTRAAWESSSRASARARWPSRTPPPRQGRCSSGLRPRSRWRSATRTCPRSGSTNPGPSSSTWLIRRRSRSGARCGSRVPPTSPGISPRLTSRSLPARRWRFRARCTTRFPPRCWRPATSSVRCSGLPAGTPAYASSAWREPPSTAPSGRSGTPGTRIPHPCARG